MKHFVQIFLAAVLVSGLSSAQQSASMQNASSPEVQAGNVVTFNINLDKAPNFKDSALLVTVAPKDAKARRDFRGVQNTAPAKGTSGDYSVSLRIPPTAPEGAWTVTSVRLLVPAGPSVPLTVSAPDFEVRQNQNVELPTTATVSAVQSQ